MVSATRSATEFSLVLDHFLPFAPPNNPGNENFEKMKKTTGVFIVLHKRTITIIRCMVLEIWSMTEFSHLLPPRPAQKIKVFWKMKKNHLEIIILYMCTKNTDQMMHGSWDLVHGGWSDRQIQMDGQMDGQTDKKKWHIEVGAPLKEDIRNKTLCYY